MTDLTKEQLLAIIDDACPRCKERVKVTFRVPYAEWIHEKISAGQSGGNNQSYQICMATHLRNKYKDLLSG